MTLRSPALSRVAVSWARSALGALVLLGACSTESKSGDSSPAESEPGDTAAPSCAPPEWSLSGCLVRTFDDHDADGRFPEVGTKLYDGEGRLVSWDERSPVEWDGYFACWRSYDGALLVEEVCVGQPSYRYTWTYAGDRVESRSYDAGDDGVIDKVWTYTTDEQGRVLAEDIDEDLDGEPDARVEYTYDADGNRSTESWDYDLDGTIDFTSQSTFEDGRRVLEERDTDGNGTVDATKVWSFDEWGQPLEAAEDDNNDGSPELTTTWSYEGCEPVNTITIDASGRRSVVELTVDALRRTVRELHDFDSDGVADQDVRTSYECPNG